MLKLTIALAGLAAAAACSRSAPEREASRDVPRREQLEIAPAEERPTTARRAEPTARSEPSKKLEEPSAPASRPKPTARPKPTPEPVPVTDYAPVADTVAEQRTEETSPPDTVPVSEPSGEPTIERSAGADTAGYAPYPTEEHAPETTASAAPAPAPDDGGTLEAGTVIHTTLEDSIHSRIDVSGKEVQGRVMQNVTNSEGEVLIPAGAPVRLTVTQVKPGRGDRKGVLEMRTDSITIEGRPRKLEATIRTVPHELRGRGMTGEEAAKIGVGAAGGAVAGRVITGETKGAVIGGVVGAAGGAVVASETAKKDVVVKARTPLELVLTTPLVTR
jgi:hypothetical protein